MLETNRKKGIIKLGTNNNNKTIMSHSQGLHHTARSLSLVQSLYNCSG